MKGIKELSWQTWLYFAGAVATLIVPFVTGGYGLFVGALVLIHIIIAVSYNFLLGYAGQFSLGHVALYGMGAYGTGAAVVHFGLPYGISIGLGAIFAGAVGTLVALPALRLRVFYLAIATLALTMLAHWVFMHGGSITGGGSGLRAGRPDFSWVNLSSDFGAYFVVWFATILVLIFSYRAVASPSGRQMLCLGEREFIAASLGINVFVLKLKLFITTGIMAGLAGGLNISIMGIADPETFYIVNLILFFMFVAIGGFGIILGSVAGAVGVTLLWEGLRVFEGLHEIALGFFLLLSMVLLPRGVVGALADRFPKWRERRHDDRALTAVLSRDAYSPFSPEGGSSGSTDVNEKNSGTVGAAVVSNEASVPAVSIRGVNKSFGGITAIRDLDIEIPAGKVHGVIGPNGSGKSTLINLISGLETADSGVLSVFGRPAAEIPVQSMAANGIVRTFQEVQIVHKLSVLENVLLGVDARFPSSPADTLIRTRRFAMEEQHRIQRSLWAMDFVGISHLATNQGEELSGGQMRLVEIARAVASEPKMILFDEPAAGLALDRIDALKDLIVRINQDLNVTVVLVEHVLNLVLDVSDEVTVLHGGSRLFNGSPAAARGDENVRKAYFGD